MSFWREVAALFGGPRALLEPPAWMPPLWSVTPSKCSPEHPLTTAALLIDDLERQGGKLKPGVDRTELIHRIAADFALPRSTEITTDAVLAKVEAAFVPPQRKVRYFRRDLVAWGF